MDILAMPTTYGCLLWLYMRFTQVSFCGWKLAFVLLQWTVQLMTTLSVLLCSLFLLAFVVREVAECAVQLLTSCVEVGDACVGLATRSDAAKCVFQLTRMLQW